MFDGVEFPAKAIIYERTWAEAWTWMCDVLNLVARVDEKPGMMCSFEKFHEKPQRGPVLPYMMTGRHQVKRAAKSEPKEVPRFYLTSGNDHASDCSKIMLWPSGIATYLTDVTWGYWRAPFGGGTAMAGSPSPAKGGAVSDPTLATASTAGLRGVVPDVDAIDWCNTRVFAQAPACCVVRTAAAGADVSDRCIAGVLARVPSPCATRDRCIAGILARASVLYVGGSGAAAAATAGIAGGDAVGVAATGGAGPAAWLPFDASLAGEYRHDHCRPVPAAHARP